MELSDDSDKDLISLGNTLPYLFHNGYLTDIECRKIARTRELVERRAAIYLILETKTSKVGANIVEIFRDNTHPLLNHKILKIIFGFLSKVDAQNFHLVCQDWNYAASPHSMNVLKDVKSISEKFFLQVSLMRKIRYMKKPDELGGRSCNYLSSYIKNTEIYLKEQKELRQDLSSTRASIFQQLLLTKYKRAALLLKILFGNPYGKATNIYKFSIKALQNETILNHILGFLCPKHIKKFRLVCRLWNSVAETMLRKQTRVVFSSALLPKNFIEVFKYPPNALCTSFAFSLDDLNISVLTTFLSKWGKIVKYLLIRNIKLKHDMTILCLSNAPNLTELHLEGEWGEKYPAVVPWDKLHSIQILHLKDIGVTVDIDKENIRRIVPVKLTLDNVRFYMGEIKPDEIIFNDFVDFGKAEEIDLLIIGYRQRQVFDWSRDKIKAGNLSFHRIHFINWATSDEKRYAPLKISLHNARFLIDGRGVPRLVLNDFLDFSKAKEIKISDDDQNKHSFDWTKDRINAEKIIFERIDFRNWAKSQAKVNFLSLGGFPFNERNAMEIKELLLEKDLEVNSIDLSTLPAMLERFSLHSRCSIEVSQPLNLSLLKFFSFDNFIRDNEEDNASQVIPLFSECLNLEDIALKVETFDVKWLPKNLRRLKICFYTYKSGHNTCTCMDGKIFWRRPPQREPVHKIMKKCVTARLPRNISLRVGGDRVRKIHLDLLVLIGLSLDIFTEVLNNIKPKVLVMTVYEESDYDAFVPFLLKNKQIKKIFVHFCLQRLRVRFLSLFVDRKAKYYEFTHQCGRAITGEQFQASALPFNVDS